MKQILGFRRDNRVGLKTPSMCLSDNRLYLDLHGIAQWSLAEIINQKTKQYLEKPPPHLNVCRACRLRPHDIPAHQVLAARSGVVVASCSHFGEGGMKRSLRPRANFVALRHADGTYTRYVHLQRNGVLVQLGEVRIKK